MSKDTGGPAFPLPFIYDPDMGANGMYVDGEDSGTGTGITIRDYFAAKAMQAQISNPLILERHGLMSEEVCRFAYDTADAMLKARGE